MKLELLETEYFRKTKDACKCFCSYFKCWVIFMTFRSYIFANIASSL